MKSAEQTRVLGEREAWEKELTWDDIQEMKHTWRVAQEMMRIIPPVFGNFKRVIKDTSFSGFNIPKGWQVTVRINQKNGIEYVLTVKKNNGFRYSGYQVGLTWTRTSSQSQRNLTHLVSKLLQNHILHILTYHLGQAQGFAQAASLQELRFC